ncbi:MAG: prepilin-type N-terminal cleavage/methylation domain-containing protein [Candidatus Hydrogenedentes bacterium]|nr:prepilin-type N-terminal cleavage/methylation domain-containing protein [Candidatus Hydrogenedentota bacterium]
MRSARGFTLVELLVVIAIITILAGIVVPQVTKHLAKARMTKAVAEISQIETALTAILADAGCRSFSQMALPALKAQMYQASIDASIQYQTDMFYMLLRQGRDAELALRPEARSKLGTSYLELGKDPWDNVYLFFAGPWRGWDTIPSNPIPFRAWREGEEDTSGLYLPYVYDATAKSEADADIPGNPPADSPDTAGDDVYGFPAPKDLSIYVWSRGANLLSDQHYNKDLLEDEYQGGGDDVNNWDTASSWAHWYS